MIQWPEGYDRQVVSHLRHACAEHGFRIYLASFTKEVTGSCEDDSYYGRAYGGGSGHHLIDEEIESSMTLTRVVDLNGNEVTKNIDFDEDKSLINDPFEGAEPDDEDFSGYTGNEGVSTTHFYRRTVWQNLLSIFQLMVYQY